MKIKVVFWRRSLPTHGFACLLARPSVRLFQLASGEVSLIILTSTVVVEYHRVFHNFLGPKMNSATLRLFCLAEQGHTQNFYLRCFKSDFDAVKSKFGLLIE